MRKKKQQKSIVVYQGQGYTNYWRKSKDRKDESTVHTTGKNSARKPEKNAIIDNFISCVVKRIVMDFYDEKKIVPY